MLPAVYSFFALLLVGKLAAAEGRLLCYECSLSHGDDEESMKCVTEPEKIPNSVRTCLPHLKACKIVRTEHKDTGRLVAFVRACSFPGQDSERINSDYRIIHKYCHTSKCNRGNGIDNDVDGSNRRIAAILVKDLKGTGHRIHVSFLLLLSLFLPLSFSQLHCF